MGYKKRSNGKVKRSEGRERKKLGVEEVCFKP
jgi:hypothetical protein